MVVDVEPGFVTRDLSPQWPVTVTLTSSNFGHDPSGRLVFDPDFTHFLFSCAARSDSPAGSAPEINAQRQNPIRVGVYANGPARSNRGAL